LFEETGPQADTPACRYPEWSEPLLDYLRDHTRVQETVPAAGSHSAFYAETLKVHSGLIKRVRRAFELLRPKGLALLRQWPEGDAFDYRALLDFAVERRAGLIPSDRLFIKRLKQIRDVAVLLLVDVSRSTANPIARGQATVLEVAKSALVVFSEALVVVGDQFAIAGFSGTGRYSVDYFRIKDFEMPMSETVRERISNLSPQRSTRMGAAIRHAAAMLRKISAQVHLLMILSDGFPNDLGYKGNYAIADTRRAVMEARAKSIYVKAITVNMGNDPRLDELYGRTHHHVIGDIQDLPDRLIRLYGALTKL
jgi:nitric oxide reductase activation protein